MSRKCLRVVQRGDIYLVQELTSRFFFFKPKWKTIFEAQSFEEACAVHYCRSRELGLPCL